MTLGSTITIIVTTGGISERVQATVTRMSGTDCIYVTPTEGEWLGREFRLGYRCKLATTEKIK